MRAREMSKIMSSIFIHSHECCLPSSSQSCLPELPPYASRGKRLWRQLKKCTIMDSKSPLCRRYFRSNASTVAERQRHAKQEKFVIHPFSSFETYRNYLRCLLLIISYFVDPFITSYQTSFMNFDPWFYIQAVTDLFHFFFIIIEFFVGVHEPFTRDIILDRSYKIKRYFSTYFFFDFISCLPFKYIIYKIWNPDPLKTRIMFIGTLKSLRLVRLPGTFLYMEELIDSASSHVTLGVTLCLIVVLFLLVYWLSCFAYVTPILIYTIEKVPKESWIVAANIDPLSNTTAVFHCTASVLTTVAHFFGAGNGPFPIVLTSEMLMFSFITICGYVFCIFLMAKIIQICGSSLMAESKYDEFLYQIKEYVKTKKLPPVLKQRLLSYYQYKFQTRFFKEDALLNTLSEHLRYEIFLFSCRNLIEKVPIVQSMSKAMIGSIIGQLTREVYLSNDVIIKFGEPVMDMYFIVHGTVAYYLPDGKEVLHVEDGMNFGEVHLLEGTPCSLNVVAIEITEVLMLNKKHLVPGKDDEIRDEIYKAGAEKRKLLMAMTKYSAAITTKDVSLDLQRGKILVGG